MSHTRIKWLGNKTKGAKKAKEGKGGKRKEKKGK